MKKYAAEFIRRGLMVMGGGPLVLAVIYAVLGQTGVIDSLTPTEVFRGVLSVAMVTFIAGGVSMIYTIDRLAPAPAACIHGAVLYAAYLIMYLLNDWIPRDPAGIGLFTAVFVAGYAVVWLFIWLIVRRNTESINRKIRQGSAR